MSGPEPNPFHLKVPILQEAFVAMERGRGPNQSFCSAIVGGFFPPHGVIQDDADSTAAPSKFITLVFFIVERSLSLSIKYYKSKDPVKAGL